MYHSDDLHRLNRVLLAERAALLRRLPGQASLAEREVLTHLQDAIDATARLNDAPSLAWERAARPWPMPTPVPAPVPALLAAARRPSITIDPRTGGPFRG